MRASLQGFTLPNRALSSGQLWAYTVDQAGDRTDNLAPLFSSEFGGDALPNPQRLDSQGKLVQPVYIDQAVICIISSPNTPVFQTGIIFAPLVGRNLIKVSGNYAASLADANGFILASALTAQSSVTLPAASPANTLIGVKKIDPSGNAVVVSGPGTIDGEASFPLEAQYQFIDLVFDGMRWHIIGMSPSWV
ncbi:MAG: hypothetical protein IPK75_18910 [Acidobacteria bacterium]|nr:hypothetical protein [Acidobacteriota bacterium]